MKQQAILSLKGVINEEGGEKAVALRVDGIIASNHGGRQIEVMVCMTLIAELPLRCRKFPDGV